MATPLSLSPASLTVASSAPTSPAGSASVAPTRARSLSQSLADQRQEERRQQLLDAEMAQRTDDTRDGHSPDGISAKELRQEMETLLSLRRRSMSQPASVDPDLPETTTSAPPPQPSSRPTLTITTTSDVPGGGPVSPTAISPAETGTLTRRRSSVSSTRLPSDHPLPSPPPVPSPVETPTATSTPNDAPPLSSHNLFWLPASLHPELAPREFKAFIREQTRPDALERRTSSSLALSPGTRQSGRLDKRKSMLRGEYKPSSDDGVPEHQSNERGKGLARTASDGSRRTSGRYEFKELTISDLQKLEQLAAKAEAEAAAAGEGEGERLGRMLRRSLSLNPNLVAAAAASGANLDSDSADAPASDSPLVVHSPGQILRRTARTKIRKPGLGGDGGGHRFGPSRRVRSASAEFASDEHESSFGDTSFESGESDEAKSVHGVDSAEGASTASSPSSDLHVQYFEVATPPVLDPQAVVTVEPNVASDVPSPPPPPPPVSVPAGGVSPSSADYDWSTHHRPPQQPRPYPHPPVQAPAPLPIPVPERRDSMTASMSSSGKPSVPKKSGWARLGLGSDGKKRKGKAPEMDKLVEATARQQALDREREEKEQRDREKRDNKDTGFFGALFSKRKSDQEHVAPPTPSPPPEAPARQPPPPTASGTMLPDGTYINFYRLPIHVERAVYRLSHIKLANPRRPLYEQVLISNLMFWYLSVINKPLAQMQPVQQMHGQPYQPAPTTEPQPMQVDPVSSDVGEMPAGKRASLSKPVNDGRRSRSSAELPVKQPRFDQQNRQIAQEYGQPGFATYDERPSKRAATSEGGHSFDGSERVNQMSPTEQSSAPADMFAGSSTPVDTARTMARHSLEYGGTIADEDVDEDEETISVDPSRRRAPGKQLPAPTPSSASDKQTSAGTTTLGHERRDSEASERSFDEVDLIDEYNTRTSPTQTFRPVLPDADDPMQYGDESTQVVSTTELLTRVQEGAGSPKSPLFGMAAPRRNRVVNDAHVA
ncbi:hypothetical protein ACM66B_001755 [Microbotryomycetes sp. NB124-2]